MATSLEYKVEEAARLWLLAVGTHGYTIIADVRHADEDLTALNLDGTTKVPQVAFPCIILRARKIKQWTPGLNIHLVQLGTELWVAADDVPAGRTETPSQLFEAIAAARENILLWDDLKERLSERVTGFLVHGIQEFSPTVKTTVERHWVHRMDVLLWAQPSDGA